MRFEGSGEVYIERGDKVLEKFESEDGVFRIHLIRVGNVFVVIKEKFSQFLWRNLVDIAVLADEKKARDVFNSFKKSATGNGE